MEGVANAWIENLFVDSWYSLPIVGSWYVFAYHGMGINCQNIWC
jgi:hypothetical protein